MELTDIMGIEEIEITNTHVDEIDSENVNLIFTGIDCSGSMYTYDKNGTMSTSLNEFKIALENSKESDEILVARADFSDEANIGGYKKINEYNTNYHASGMTALYDVIVEGSKKLSDYMEYLRKQGVRVKAVFSIFSDGEDTSSNYTVSDAKNAINELNKKEITTAFISFGGESINIAKQMGFKNILDTASSATELRKAFNCLSKSVIESSKSVLPDNDDFFQM